MAIRKLSNYRDISAYDESISNNISVNALSKISVVDGIPKWDGAEWPSASSAGTYSSNQVVEYIVPTTCQEFTLSNLDSNAWVA